MTAGTWVLVFILYEPLLAFTGITPKEDDPLLDIHEVTQNCTFLYQCNRIPEGDVLQTPGFHSLGFYWCSYHLKRVTLMAWDSSSPLETTHTFSFREKKSWVSNSPTPLILLLPNRAYPHERTSNATHRLYQGATGVGDCWHHKPAQCPRTSVPCRHSGLAVITLKAISVQDHYRPASCSYTLKSDSMKVVWGWGREERGV